MTASIRVQGAEQPLALDDFSQRGHHRNRRLFFHQLGVIDFTGGVVQNHDQVIPALILKPLVPAPVDVQQHARQRAPFAPLAVQAALAGLGH